MKTINARFPSKCAKCANPILRGDLINYDKTAPTGKKTWHVVCPPAEQAAPAAPAAVETPQAAPAAVVTGEVWRMHHRAVADFMTLPIGGKSAEIFNGYVSQHHSDGWMFADAVNLETCTKRVTEGWPEGVERIHAIKTREIAAPVSLRRTMHWTDQGDSLDIHRVYSGQLDTAWRRTRRTARNSPRNVRIVPMIAGSCRLSPDQFFYRGAAVCKLADMLTAAGYGVDITAACVALKIADNRDGPHYCHTLTLKDFTAPLDVSTLAAVICQPGFTRYYMFRSFAALPEHTIGSHMGWYGDTDTLDALARAAHIDSAPVTTVFMKYETDTAEKCGQWIADALDTVEGEHRQAA